jgi:hypothetical protein
MLNLSFFRISDRMELLPNASSGAASVRMIPSISHTEKVPDFPKIKPPTPQ